MPSTHIHQHKQSNALLAQSDLKATQNRTRHADWIVTLAFYRALHAVDSYLADKCQIDPLNHAERRRHVQQQLSLYTGRVFCTISR